MDKTSVLTLLCQWEYTTALTRTHLADFAAYIDQLATVAEAARGFVAMVRGLEWDDEQVCISTIVEFRAIEDALAVLGGRTKDG